MKIKLYLLSAFFLVFSAGLFFLPDILASSITTKEQRTVDISSLSSASSSIETAMSQAQSFSIMEESEPIRYGQSATRGIKSAISKASHAKRASDCSRL